MVNSIYEEITDSFHLIGKKGYAVQRFEHKNKKDYSGYFYSVRACEILGFQFGVNDGYNKLLATDYTTTFVLNKEDFVETAEEAYNHLIQLADEKGDHWHTFKAPDYKKEESYWVGEDRVRTFLDDPSSLIFVNKSAYGFAKLGLSNEFSLTEDHSPRETEDEVKQIIDDALSKYSKFFIFDNKKKKAVEVSKDDFRRTSAT